MRYTIASMQQVIKSTKCRICGSQFETKRRWQKFCSDKCRHAAWLLPKRIALAEYVCIYCGENGDTVDHIPPRTARAKLVALGLADQYPFEEVRSCLECNSALGKRALWTVRERKRFIKKWLAKRYGKFLKLPEWTSEDILGLGSMLQREVINGLAIKHSVEKRLLH